MLAHVLLDVAVLSISDAANVALVRLLPAVSSTMACKTFGECGPKVALTARVLLALLGAVPRSHVASDVRVRAETLPTDRALVRLFAAMYPFVAPQTHGVSSSEVAFVAGVRLLAV